jgi:hypothetical protein
MIDLQQFLEFQIPDARASIDQYIVVDQQRGRSLITPADPSAATQNPQLHFVLIEIRQGGATGYAFQLVRK